MSYHHSSDLKSLDELRDKFKNKRFGDYGFKDKDLGESSKWKISKEIQSRLWSTSVTIVLIGEKTGDSSWIDWEIWYSLKSFHDPNVSRRRFKPKGLLALYLNTEEHNVPKRLQENIDSGYAVEIYWNELDSMFDDKINQAYKNRELTQLIKNNIPLRDNPRKKFGNLNLSMLFGLRKTGFNSV